MPGYADWEIRVVTMMIRGGSVRIGIADDSALFRTGLAEQLRHLGFDVCIEAQNGDQLATWAESDPPDVVILDIRMPPTFTGEGLATAAALRSRHPRLGILVLSTYAESHYAATLLELGDAGVGYLVKDRVDDAEALGAAVRTIAAGGCVVDPQIVAGLLRHHRALQALDRLSPREREVLGLMAEGRSNTGIAHSMHLAPKTVEKHVAAIFSELNLPFDEDDNRRVIAVLKWLRATGRTRR
jgi:DNA-binding NarL/FixJ family response regulator